MTTWNASDKSASLTLSGGNLTATTAEFSWQGVRSTTSKTSGKQYFEVTLGAKTSQTVFNAYIGLAVAAADFTADGIFGNSPNTCEVDPNFSSNFFLGSGAELTAGAATDNTGAVISFAIDFTANRLWYSTNAMRLGTAPFSLAFSSAFGPRTAFNWNWNATANPATGVGGLDISTMTAGAKFAFFQAWYGYGVTANFGASPWTVQPPSGFAAWDAGGTVWSGDAAIAVSGGLLSGSVRGTVRVAGAAQIDGTASVIAGATVTHIPVTLQAAATIGGSSDITVTATHTPFGSARIGISGTVTVDGAPSVNVILDGAIIAGGVTGVVSTAVVRRAAQATVSGSAAILVQGTVVGSAGATTWDGAARVAVAGSVLASATHTPLGAARIGGNASLFADATVFIAGHALWQAAATIGIAGTLRLSTTRQILSGRAGISIFGSLTASTAGQPLPQQSSIGGVVGLPFYVASVEARQPGFGTFAFAKGWATTAWNTISLHPGSVEATATFYASDVGYRSRTTDSGGLISYPPILVEAFALDRAFALDPGGAAAGWQWGTIQLANDDGRFDAIAETWNVDGRPVQILSGTKTWDDTRGIWVDPSAAALVPVFKGLATPWLLDIAALKIPLRDATYWLEKPVHSGFYGGSGNYNGTTQLTGVWRPMTRGGTNANPIANVTPLLIDPVNLIYQYNNGPGTVVNLYEGLKTGAGGITFSANTTDLYSGSTTPGQYRTDNSRGLFQLGSTPIHTITADVTGEFPIAGVVTNPALIVLNLMAEDMLLPVEHIDVASFTAAAANYPYTAGIHFAPNDNPDGASAVARVLSSFGAKLSNDRIGRLSCFVLRGILSTTPPVAKLNTTNVVSIARVSLPPTIDPPPYRLRLAWNHNYTVETSDLNATADQARVQFAAAPDSYSTWTSLEILRMYRRPNDPPPFSGGALLVEADAAAVVADLGLLWGAQRALYEVTVPMSVGLTLDLGDPVDLTFPAGALRNGQMGQVVGERFRSIDSTIMLLVLASVTSTVGTLQQAPVSARLLGTASIVARGVLRAAAQSRIGVIGSLSVDASIGGVWQISARINGAGSLTATGTLRAKASARVSVAGNLLAAASLVGGVVPPGQPTNVAVDAAAGTPGVPGNVQVT